MTSPVHLPVPGWIDHLLVIAIVAVWPLLEAVWYHPRAMRALRAGAPGARGEIYRNLMAPSWLLTVAVLVLWAVHGRPWARLFLTAGGWTGALIGAACCALMLGLLWQQQRSIAARPAALDAVRRSMAFAEPMMPHTPGERRMWRLVSVTAGITEEILFRGYVFWYVAAWVGPITAVGIGSILFGFGHVYLGFAQVPRTAIGGVVASLIVLASGSLWPAILIHAAVDMENGELGYRVFGMSGAN